MNDKRKTKIKTLIDRVTQPNVKICDADLTILSKYLTGISIGDVLDEEYFITWLKNALQQWKTSKEKYSLNALLLITDVMGLKCYDEQVFLNLNFNGLLDDVFEIMKSLPEIQTNSCIQHYFLRLISAFLKHKSGTQWIIATNFWYDILALTSKTDDEEIFKAGCGFMVELVARTKSDNEIFCNNVIKMLVAPLHNFQKSITGTDDSMVVDKENSNSQIVKELRILETFFNKMLFKCCSENQFKVITMLHERFRIDELLENLTKQVTDDELHFQLNKILSLVYYFIIAKELKDNSVSLEKTTKVNFYSAKVYEVIRDEAFRSTDYSKVLKLIHLDHIYFSSIVNDLPCANIANMEFQYQMIAFLFIPVDYAFTHFLGMKEYRIIAKQNAVREEFTNKVVRKILPLTFQTIVRIQYSPKGYKIADAISAFRHIQECCRFYDTSVIHTIVEAMVYVFTDIVKFLHDNRDAIQRMPQDFMISILETCIYLFSEFDFTWKDILETIFLTDNLAKCLSLPGLSTEVMVKALQFFVLSIKKNFHANLALLMGEIDDRGIEDFGVFMKNKIDNPCWEIRNESLNILQVIVEKSRPYSENLNHTKLITHHDFPSLVMKMCKTDTEITVRINAIRCLQTMFTLTKYWEYLQNEGNLQDQIMQMYYLEADGVLRAEAVALITTIYENHTLSSSFLEKLYDGMTYAVLEDEFTAVKINTLVFWMKVVEQHLKDEGMIDGEFPETTFSKDLKKIITFDEFQIRKCLYKVLCKLSEIGCLTVFLYALNCNSNEELLRVATDLLKPFLLLCKNHFYPATSTESEQTPIVMSPRTESVSSKTVTAVGSPRPAESLSPYPESLYDDILDLQESLKMDSEFFQSIFEDTVSQNPGVVQRNEFLRFVGDFDFSVYNKPKEGDEIDEVLNSILNS